MARAWFDTGEARTKLDEIREEHLHPAVADLLESIVRALERLDEPDDY